MLKHFRKEVFLNRHYEEMLYGYGPSEVFNPELEKLSRTGHTIKTKTKNDFLYNIVANSFYYHVY